MEKFECDKRKKLETYIEQGCELGRPSLIKLEVEFEVDKMRAVRVGGHAVRIGEGVLY